MRGRTRSAAAARPERGLTRLDVRTAQRWRGAALLIAFGLITRAGPVFVFQADGLAAGVMLATFALFDGGLIVAGACRIGLRRRLSIDDAWIRARLTVFGLPIKRPRPGARRP